MLACYMLKVRKEERNLLWDVITLRRYLLGIRVETPSVRILIQV